MDVYQPVCQHFQLLQGDHAVVHERPALAVGVQLATNDTIIKFRLDDTFVLAVGDSFRVRTSTQHQRQSTQDNGLTGTRLTRQHREAFTEIDVQLTDQRVVLYV